MGYREEIVACKGGEALKNHKHLAREILSPSAPGRLKGHFCSAEDTSNNDTVDSTTRINCEETPGD